MKPWKSTESFVKQRLPVANIWNYEATAKNSGIFYVSTILASKKGETTFQRQCLVYADNLE